MNVKTVACLAGDGVGPELMAAATRALERGTEGLDRDVLRAIERDHPAWRPEHGWGARCSEVYRARPRRARESPLFRLVEQHLEEFLRAYPARFAKAHGPLRSVVGRVLRGAGDIRVPPSILTLAPRRG